VEDIISRLLVFYSFNSKLPVHATSRNTRTLARNTLSLAAKLRTGAHSEAAVPASSIGFFRGGRSSASAWSFSA